MGALSRIRGLVWRREPPAQPPSAPSDDVDVIVDGFMKNNSINNPLIPDFLERRIYRNVLLLLRGCVSELAKTAAVDFLGVRVQFLITPNSETQGECLETQGDSR